MGGDHGLKPTPESEDKEMTDLPALKELLARVEAGDAPEYSLFREAYVPTVWQSLKPHEYKAWLSYQGSLDSASSLHEAVLPDNAAWWVEKRADGRIWSGVFLGNLGKTYEAYADNPARAWLIAILSALIAEAENE